MVKNLPASAGDARDVGSIPDQEDPLKEEMATHSTILAWNSPWTEEPVGLLSTEWHRVEHAWRDSTHAINIIIMNETILIWIKLVFKLELKSYFKDSLRLLFMQN